MKTRIAAVAALLAVGPRLAAAEPWNTYANARFGYDICYPANLLTPQEAADNGNGRQFTSSVGATLRVWGNYNVNGDTLATLTDEMVRDLTGSSGTVSYRRVASSFSTVSGQAGGNVFYAVRRMDKDAVNSFILTYPIDKKGLFDPVAAKLAKCFHTEHARSR